MIHTTPSVLAAGCPRPEGRPATQARETGHE